jgi:type VI secretion system protein
MRLTLSIAAGGTSLSDRDRKRTLLSSGPQSSLSIGRSPDNDWVLREGTISRSHCLVAFADGCFTLTDRSTNGLFVNDAPTQRNTPVMLNEGDTIALGNYLIAVTVADDPPAAEPRREGAAAGRTADGSGRAANGGDGRGSLDADPLVDPPRRPVDPSPFRPLPQIVPQRRGTDPFETTSRPPGSSSEFDKGQFDDRLAGVKPSSDWHGLPQPDHAPATAEAMVPSRVVSSRKVDFDAIIGDVPGTPRGAPRSSQVEPRRTEPFDPRDDLEPPANEPGRGPRLPEARRRGTSRDPSPETPAADDFTRDQGSFAEHKFDNRNDPFGGGPPAAVARPRTTSSDERFGFPASDDDADMRPAVVRSSGMRPAGGAQRQETDTPRDRDAEAALAAFLDGAGVSGDDIDASDPVAALRAAGKIFRAMTAGLQQALKSRAVVKKDLGIDQTILSASGNNALKFAVTTDDAVRLLLTPRAPGYMEPLSAARQAANDIEAHELAVMVGMQQALLSMLHRFDPDELEKRLAAGGFGGLLPAARKARFWDAFRQSYADLSREVEDEFQNVFGRPFAKAYNRQARKKN